MKKIIWGVVVLIVIGGLVTGFFLMNKNQSNIKIGLATLLSGDYAILGENIRDTATLVIDEINSNGGVNGKMIELIVEDAKVDGKSGLSAVSKLINLDRVNYVIAGMSSNGTLAAAPIANENKVALLVPVTGGSDIDNAGEYVFRIANSDNLGGRDIARGMNNLGFKDVAVVTEVTDYTLNFRDSFNSEAKKIGLNILLDEQFQPNETDFRTTVLKIEQKKPTAVLILSQTGLTGAYFIKQIREKGLSEITLFSDFNLVTNSDTKKLLGSFNGIYFTDPAYNDDNQELKEFFDRYNDKYGHMPAIPFHSAATYDSLQMLIKAIDSVGDDKEAVHDWLLSNVKNWEGFMGTYSLDEKGNSDIGFVLKLVVGDEYIKVK
jgi:branched-chain amino acid transport system substrate-binding protein